KSTTTWGFTDGPSWPRPWPLAARPAARGRRTRSWPGTPRAAGRPRHEGSHPRIGRRGRAVGGPAPRRVWRLLLVVGQDVAGLLQGGVTPGAPDLPPDDRLAPVGRDGEARGVAAQKVVQVAPRALFQDAHLVGGEGPADLDLDRGRKSTGERGHVGR